MIKDNYRFYHYLADISLIYIHLAMQRILVLLQKLNDLANSGTKPNLIETDLMLDYTRVLYADLLEARAALGRTSILPKNEPTLDELAKAYEQQVEKETPAPPKPAPAPAPSPTPPSFRQPVKLRIAINDKYLLLSALFGNNVNAYESAMNTLSRMGSLQEARQWIKTQDWPQDEIAVQLLNDIVQQHFT